MPADKPATRHEVGNGLVCVGCRIRCPLSYVLLPERELHNNVRYIHVPVKEANWQPVVCPSESIAAIRVDTFGTVFIFSHTVV